MKPPKDLHRRITDKYGSTIDLKKNPDVLQDIVEEVSAMLQTGEGTLGTEPPASPFGVSWMDSWVAHWVYSEKLRKAVEGQNEEVAQVLRSLVDLKFNERIGEMRRFLRDHGPLASPPDGGTPEPGVPPAGPAGPARFEPPDGGPPEPGTGPGPTGPAIFEPPDAGPPEPGVPPGGPARFDPPDGGPPEPGVPPTGPDAGFLRENPWILYWFVSVKAPLLLDVIDAHMTRRLNELSGSSQ
jgi:hypothetical protein